MFFYWFSRLLFKACAKILFRLKIENTENLPKQGGFILASNHASSIDPLMVTVAISRPIRWLVIYEYYDLWYLRWIFKQMRFIRSLNSLPKEAFRALLCGEIIGIFPEGRRTWDGHLGHAKRGVATLARRTAVPVVPLAISGTFTALPRTRKLPKPCPVILRIGQPLFFAKCGGGEDSEKIDGENARKVMRAIGELLKA